MTGMEILGVIFTAIVVMGVIAVIINFLRDLFTIFVYPIIFSRTYKRTSILYKMGMFETADIIEKNLRRTWRDLM